MKSPHLDRDWLYQKYIVEGLSTYAIAAIVNRDPKRIYEKLRDFGIPTRPRGLNLAGADNYMKRPGVINPFAGHTHTEETRRVLSEKASVEKPYLRGAHNGMHGRTGALNPRYKDGSAPERQILYARGEGKAFLRDILKRDGYLCKRCGAPHSTDNALHVHHLHSWAGNPELRFDPDNVITLCRRCHNWVHSRLNLSAEYLK